MTEPRKAGGLLAALTESARLHAAPVRVLLDTHIGVDGIRSRDDSTRVKGLVAGVAEKCSWSMPTIRPRWRWPTPVHRHRWRW